MLVRQSAAYTLGRVIPAVITLPALAVYTRLLSPSEFGTYVAAMSVVSLAQSSLMSWLEITALRLWRSAEHSRALAAALLLSFSVVVGIGAAGSAIFAANSDSNPLVVWLGFVAFASGGWLDLNTGLVRAELRAGRYLWISVARAVITAGTSIGLAVAGWGAAGLLTGVALGSAVPSLLFAAQRWRNVRSWDIRRDELSKVLRYGVPLIVGFVSEGMSVNADRLLLSVLQRPEAVGLYGAAYVLPARILSSIVNPVGSAGFALAVSALEVGGRPAALEQVRRNVILLMAIGMPVVFGLAAVSSDLAAVMIGSKFRGAAESLLPLITLSCFLITLRQQYLEVAFHLAHRTGAYARVIFVVAVAGIAFNALLIPSYGASGAAYAMLGSQAIGFVMTMIAASRVFPLPVPGRDLLKLSSATLLMVVFVHCVPGGHGIVSLGAKVSIGAVVYALAVVAFDVNASRKVLAKWIRQW